MGMQEKLATMTERRQQIEQELQDLRETRRESSNSALADLEKALMSELERVGGQISQINDYLKSCSVANGDECS